MGLRSDDGKGEGGELWIVAGRVVGFHVESVVLLDSLYF